MIKMATQPKIDFTSSDEDWLESEIAKEASHDAMKDSKEEQDFAMLQDQEHLTPSWFSRTYSDQNQEDLAQRYQTERPVPLVPPAASPGPEAYEAYRRRLEERFKLAQKIADPAFAPLPPLPERRAADPVSAFPTRQRRTTAMEKPLAVKSQHRLHWPQIAFLTLLACAVGGGGGFVVANPSSVKDYAAWSKNQLLAMLPAAAPSQTKVASTDIAKKAIHSAKVSVNDIAGSINSAIPLDITALPPDESGPLALKISGLPPEAYLTKGIEITPGEWLLKAEEVAKAELVVPRSKAAELGLEVTALDSVTGESAAPSQEMRVALDLNAVPTPGVVPPPLADKSDIRIVPAAALPETGFIKAVDVPTPLQSLNPEAVGLMNKGESLLKTGDIIAARQFFLRAYELKVTEAAYGVGRTFDPAVFAEHKVRGLSPDPAKAAEWYGKSAVSGHTESVSALERLGSTAAP